MPYLIPKPPTRSHSSCNEKEKVPIKEECASFPDKTGGAALRQASLLGCRLASRLVPCGRNSLEDRTCWWLPRKMGPLSDAVALPGTAWEMAQGGRRAGGVSATNGRLTLEAHLPAKPSEGFPEARGIAQTHHCLAKAQMRLSGRCLAETCQWIWMGFFSLYTR